MPTRQSRRWCFTLNNYEDHEFDSIKTRLSELLEVSLRYAIIAREVGDSGTPHIQGYFSGKKNTTFKQAKSLISDRAHLEEAKGSDIDNQLYCSKEGDFVEIGTPAASAGHRSDLDRLCSAIKDGADMKEVADLDPATYVRNYKGLANYAALQTEHYEHDDVRGLWIWGPPGTGKSHHARLLNPESLYLKSQNKWWDGYAGEEIVLLDDFDSPMLGHHLKIWSDKWSCTGEIKGGTVKLMHKKFVITSNYTPDQLWPDETSDKNMRDAIKRRFKMIHIPIRRNKLYNCPA